MESMETGEYRPESSQVLAELRAPLAEMRRLLESAMPTLHEAHSLHYELLRQPQLARHPALRRFTHLELWELHTQVALAGLLHRALGGETSPAVLLSIGESMALLGYVVPRAAAQWRAFRQSPAAQVMPREVTRLDRLLQQDVQVNRELQTRAASIRGRLESLTGVPWMVPSGIAVALREV